ncbi:MAG: GumC family protein [Candidatus Binatia bacterium]
MAQDIMPTGSFNSAYPARSENRESFAATKEFLFFVVFKWKRLIFSAFIVFAVAAGIAMYLKPPVRSATAEILIKVDRQPLQISGLATRADKNQVSQIMNSEVQLMESRQVLQAVAMKLLGGPGKSVPADKLEAKTNSLAGNTFPVPLPDSTVLQVNYFAETSEEAESTLRLIIDEYIDAQAAIQSGSIKLLKFYEQEKQRVETELRAAEDQLNEWQGRNETVSIAQQITSHLNILEDRRRTLQQTEAQVEATRAKVVILRNQLEGQPERLVMDQDQVMNPLVTKLKDQLITAEVALQDLLQRFTEKHRSVSQKKEQVALIKKELAAAEENIIGRETTSLNPLRANLQQQLADADALLSSLMSQKGVLVRQVNGALETLAALREKKVKIDELSRLVDLHKDAFMLYGKKLEEGRIATGLGKEQLANVALIGPARATSATDLEKRIMMVILAALIGVALGTAAAFGFECVNNVLRTRQDVEFYLGLPVLAAIPDLRGRMAITD